MSVYFSQSLCNCTCLLYVIRLYKIDNIPEILLMSLKFLHSGLVYLSVRTSLNDILINSFKNVKIIPLLSNYCITIVKSVGLECLYVRFKHDNVLAFLQFFGDFIILFILFLNN